MDPIPPIQMEHHHHHLNHHDLNSLNTHEIGGHEAQQLDLDQDRTSEVK